VLAAIAACWIAAFAAVGWAAGEIQGPTLAAYIGRAACAAAAGGLAGWLVGYGLRVRATANQPEHGPA
jgi:membrane protein DedA with SNARE-associated domain